MCEQESAEDTTGGCTVTEASAPSLEITAQLLQLQKEELKAALCSRWRFEDFNRGQNFGPHPPPFIVKFSPLHDT